MGLCDCCCRISLKRGEELLEQGSKSSERVTYAIGNQGPQLRTHDADVYAVDNTDAPGVWEVENILEATYSKETSQSPEFEAHTLSIEVQDVPGILNQVRGLSNVLP